MNLSKVKVGENFYIAQQSTPKPGQATTTTYSLCTKVSGTSYTEASEQVLGETFIDPMTDKNIITLAEYAVLFPVAVPKVVTGSTKPAKKAAKKVAKNPVKTAAVTPKVAKKIPTKTTVVKAVTPKKGLTVAAKKAMKMPIKKASKKKVKRT